MKTPTKAEIELGYDGITQDGADARITAELSGLAVEDPHLAEAISRMLQASVVLGIKGGDLTLQGLLAAAMVYGLHLGLHIGEARGREQR